MSNVISRECWLRDGKIPLPSNAHPPLCVLECFTCDLIGSQNQDGLCSIRFQWSAKSVSDVGPKGFLWIAEWRKPSLLKSALM